MVVKVASYRGIVVGCRRVALVIQFLLRRAVLLRQVFVYNTGKLIIDSFVSMCDFLMVQVDDIRTQESLLTSL
jgi:hypothetical protein